MNYLVDIEFLCVSSLCYFCSHPIRERPILHPSAPAAETRWILDMGPYGAASQGELGTFTVPRHRLHKPGPKVSISQVMAILEIQAGYLPKLVNCHLATAS